MQKDGPPAAPVTVNGNQSKVADQIPFVPDPIAVRTDQFANFGRLGRSRHREPLFACLSKAIFKARVAVRTNRSANGNQFTDSVIELHAALPSLIYTDETTPNKNTVLGAKCPLNGNRIAS